MLRNIITIDEARCNGCGACAVACHEGAIQMIAGKARLVREDYCDGLGDCLPACPVDAIQMQWREAPAYDEAAVQASLVDTQAAPVGTAGDTTLACGCPGSMAHSLPEGQSGVPLPRQTTGQSALAQWPVQLKLVPASAPWFHNAHLLVAADCSAFACASLHSDYMAGRTTLIGCPKLDGVDYTEKLRDILAQNSIASVTVVRMEVPCCAGIAEAARRAVEQARPHIPVHIVTLSVEGGCCPPP